MKSFNISCLISFTGCFSICLTASVYLKFYKQVNHRAPWDIKRESSWLQTIGTPFPGYNTEVTFDGMTMTPENLGNFSYGYLGRAYGIPLSHLIGGSYYAAGFPRNGDALANEIWDWQYIIIGFNYAKKEGF